ncbi:MAG: erythromycin esterase family protein [Oligoflexus sp.]
MHIRASSEDFSSDGRDAYFYTEQNALVLKNAEAYYRTMVHGGAESWNIRDNIGKQKSIS